MHRAHTTALLRSQRLVRWLSIVGLIVSSLWVFQTDAAFRSRGAGNCGNFVDAVNIAEDGDAILNMFDGGQGRDSGGAVLVDDLTIEGGWLPPPANCPSTSGEYETIGDMLVDGFSYGGPSQRAALFAFGAPAMTIDPVVKNLRVYAHDFYVEQDEAANGGGVFGTSITSATLRFEQVGFVPDPNGSGASVTGNGGGLSLDIDNGSHLTIVDSQFTDLAADNGGGFDLSVRGGSHVTLQNIQVTGNNATNGRGGGGRIIVYSGYVTITDSLFSNNSALSEGGALHIERGIGATGPAEVWIVNTRFNGNSAPFNSDISVSGSGLIIHNLSRTISLPLTVSNETPGARIERITRTGNTYSVEFKAVGFIPAINGQHVHFFFDTTPPEQAGVPGSGPWFMYAGTSPFNLWGVADRPPGASKMCILVANANHSVIQGTGNCALLP